MHLQDILWNPRLIHRLVGERRFTGDELVFVDVGMRDGIPNYWTMLHDQMRVIGFEPDEAECQRLNALSTPWHQICYLDALDSCPQIRQFYLREHNRAADGTFSRTWWSRRFGVATDREAVGFRPYRKWEEREVDIECRELRTTSYSRIAAERNFPLPDFMKIDVEGGELDVLKGAEEFLGPSGLLGMEIEVRFIPIQECPLFIDIYNYLSSRGYYLYNFSPYRAARRQLPMPVAWDHRDHHGKPLMDGATTKGQLQIADVFFARDLIADDFVVPPGERKAQLRVLKAAAIFELYNLADCAAELLLYYRDALNDLVDVDSYLEQLVPEEFGIDGPGAYLEWLRLYQTRRGRFALDGKPVGRTEQQRDGALERALVGADKRDGKAICSAGDGGEAAFAFDGDPTTCWKSGGGTDVEASAWIGYAFGKPQAVCRVRLVQPPDRLSGHSWLKVQASRDEGASWQDTLPEPAMIGAHDIEEIDLPDAEPACRWRVVAVEGDKSPAVLKISELSFLVHIPKGAHTAPVVLSPSDGEAICGGDGSGSPERAFDGNPATYWQGSSRNSKAGARTWIGYAFPQPESVFAVRVCQLEDTSTRRTCVRVEKSLDGGDTWLPAEPGAFKLAGAASRFELPPSQPARLWRVVADEADTTKSAPWAVAELEFILRDGKPKFESLDLRSPTVGTPLSSHDNGGAPDRAVDGRLDTFWASVERGAAVENQAWLGYKFTQPKAVRRIRIGQPPDKRYQLDLIRIDKSFDGGQRWLPANPTPVRLTGVTSWIDLPPSEPARHWRLVATGNDCPSDKEGWAVTELALVLEANLPELERINTWSPSVGSAMASGDGAGDPRRAFAENADVFWISAERGNAVKDNAWIGFEFAAATAVRRICVKQTDNYSFRQDLVRVEHVLEGGGPWCAAASNPFRLDGCAGWIDLPVCPAARGWRIVAASDNATGPEHAWTVTSVEFYTPSPME